MAFADKLTVVIDFVTGPAQSGMAKLRTEVRQAEGAVGKLKAGAGALGGALSQHVAGAALAAGAALVTFGVKSVKAFQDTALAAGQFSDATGTSVESASRLIEVAGDLGIESGNVQSAIQKMNIAIAKGGPVIDRMGDSIVRAKDGTVDSAASFQNLVTKIGAIPDATARAQAAQAVFGKGYAGIAEMMEMSAGQLAARLGSVSEQKVIDEAELAKARKFRDTMDELRDNVDDLMLSIGEDLVPVITDAAGAMVNMANTFRDVSDAFEGVAGSGIVDFFSPLDNTMSGLNKVFGENVSTMDRFKGGLEVLTSIVPGASEKVSEWADSNRDLSVTIEAGTEQAREMARVYGERVPPAIDKTTTHVEDLEAAAAEAEAAAAELDRQWQVLFDTLDAEQATLDLADQFDELEAAAVTAYAAGVAGSEDAAEAQRDHQHAIAATRDQVATYAKEVLGLPPEKVTEILAMLDAGEAAKVERQLATLARYREAQIRPRILPDRVDRIEPRVKIEGVGAAGGIVNRPTVALIGEAGPEALVPLGRTPGNAPLPTGIATAPSQMVINITTGADPEDVVRAIERYKRRNGSLPFQ